MTQFLAELYHCLIDRAARSLGIAPTHLLAALRLLLVLCVLALLWAVL